jgi:hypothetical protein
VGLLIIVVKLSLNEGKEEFIDNVEFISEEKGEE